MNKRLKIFFRLKLEEIWKFVKELSIALLICGGVLGIIFGIGFGLGWLFENIIPDIVVAWLLYILVVIGLVIVGSGILVLIQDWIISNWEKAGRLCK